VGIVFAKTDHGFGIAMWATNAIRPSHVAYRLETLGIINQYMNVEHQIILDRECWTCVV
jgi:hypothetical protein